jgi:adenylate cyclase
MAASFRRFVPEAFLKILNRSDFKSIELGDQVARRMAVLVTDIRSFTTLSERMTPEQVFSFVNEFLAEVGPVIRAHSGFVNKYIGDAVMALFEGPGDGLAAAVALIRQIGVFNERRRTEGKFPIQIGVGVNSGDLMLGTIGEAERLEGSVLADAVNLCFRLESLTKTYGAQILTTDETLAELPAGTSFNVRPVDLVTVKGKRNHVTIMEVLDGHSEERLAKKLATRDLYQSAFQSFEFGVYDEAAQLFRDVAKQDPEDRAARAMMLKARKLAEGEAYTDE